MFVLGALLPIEFRKFNNLFMNFLYGEVRGLITPTDRTENFLLYELKKVIGPMLSHQLKISVRCCRYLLRNIHPRKEQQSSQKGWEWQGVKSPFKTDFHWFKNFQVYFVTKN